MRTRSMVKTIPSFLLGIGVVLILWGAVLPHSVAASAELRGGACCSTTTLQRCPDNTFPGSCNLSVLRCNEVLAGFGCSDMTGGPCDTPTFLCRVLRQQACDAFFCP